MRKPSNSKRVQQVRELSVKKSLLASDHKLEQWSQSFNVRSVEPIVQQGDELASYSVDETAVQNGLPLASSSFFLKVKTIFKPAAFTCLCPRGDVDYCCERARGWLRSALEKEQVNSKKPSITHSQLESMRQSYTRLTQTRELSDYED